MKWISFLLCAVIAGCGGGSDTPAPPPTVFIGDSITTAWPLSDYLQNTIDAGVSGQTSAQMLARFQTDVLARNPSVVVILAGTNDVLHTQNPTVANIQQMADLAAHAGARVVIGEIPPISNWAESDVIADPATGNAAVEAFNAELVMMANASGYHVADYYDELILPDGLQNTALFLDGLHPDKAGYDAMWPELKKALQ